MSQSNSISGANNIRSTNNIENSLGISAKNLPQLILIVSILNIGALQEDLAASAQTAHQNSTHNSKCAKIRDLVAQIGERLKNGVIPEGDVDEVRDMLAQIETLCAEVGSINILKDLPTDKDGNIDLSKLSPSVIDSLNKKVTADVDSQRRQSATAEDSLVLSQKTTNLNTTIQALTATCKAANEAAEKVVQRM